MSTRGLATVLSPGTAARPKRQAGKAMEKAEDMAVGQKEGTEEQGDGVKDE